MKVKRLKPDELQHHGIKGQKWGVRRYQNPDGTLTAAGRRKLEKFQKKESKALDNRIKVVDKNYKKAHKNLLNKTMKYKDKAFKSLDNQDKTMKNFKKSVEYYRRLNDLKAGYNKRIDSLNAEKKTIMNYTISDLTNEKNKYFKECVKRGNTTYLHMAGKSLLETTNQTHEAKSYIRAMIQMEKEGKVLKVQDSSNKKHSKASNNIATQNHQAFVREQNAQVQRANQIIDRVNNQTLDQVNNQNMMNAIAITNQASMMHLHM